MNKGVVAIHSEPGSRPQVEPGWVASIVAVQDDVSARGFVGPTVRHQPGSDLEDEDRREKDPTGSLPSMDHTDDCEKSWIINQADRRLTTILLPTEY